MPRDAAALLRRAYARGSPPPHVQSLFAAAGPSSGPVATLSTPQQLIQEIYEAEAFDAQRKPPGALGDAAGARDRRSSSGPLQCTDVDLLLRELCGFREALGEDVRCLSTDESDVLSALQDRLVSALVRRILAIEMERGDVLARVHEACSCLIALSVRPSTVAREIAFYVMHDLCQSLSIRSPAQQYGYSEASDVPTALFACFADMLAKCLAVVSTTGDQKISSDESAWILNAVACVSSFTTRADRDYQADRAQKLDASAVVYLLKLAISYSTDEPTTVEALAELVMCKMYSESNQTSSGAVIDRRSSSVELPNMLDIDRFGGKDLFLTIFYTTSSCELRRVVFAVFFDLAVDLLRRKNMCDGDYSWATYDTLLQVLLDCGFADMVSTRPLHVEMLASSGRLVKSLHASVEHYMPEKHIAALWTTLRELLQIDEYFLRSVSLAATLRVFSHPTQQPHETASELMINRLDQLLSAERPEDRFKGERWLAELLTHGLNDGDHIVTNQNKNKHEAQTVSLPTTADGKLEGSLCFDETAEVRIGARTKLWELCDSHLPAVRTSFTRVLSLVLRRLKVYPRHFSFRLKDSTDFIFCHPYPYQAPPLSFVRELNTCLEALVVEKEDTPTVSISAIELVLLTLTSPYDVPYIDRSRRAYDQETTSTPEELVGKLVGSSSLAAKLLTGSCSVDLTILSQFSIDLFTHVLRILNCSTRNRINDYVSCTEVSFASDYAAVSAILISFALQDASPHPKLLRVLSPFLDSRDSRVAVITAHSIINLVKRECGERRYFEIVRSLHTSAVQDDGDTSITVAVEYARAIVNHAQLTP